MEESSKLTYREDLIDYNAQLQATHLNAFARMTLSSFFFTSSAAWRGSDVRRWNRQPLVNAINLYMPRVSSQLSAYFYIITITVITNTSRIVGCIIIQSEVTYVNFIKR